MIKKLRWRIALINMGLVGTVIIGIFTAVCINNYSNSYNDLERSMNRAIEKNDISRSFEPASDDNPQPENIFGKSQNDIYRENPNIRDKAPMEISSYVVVETNAEGTITDKKEYNVTIDNDTLQQCVAVINSDNQKSGQLTNYDLMYIQKGNKENRLIVLASNSTLYSNLQRTILICSCLFIVSILIILLISMGLSRLAVKPVKTAWEQQKQFVADASHELKTPLTVILANNNIMMSHPQSTVEQERQWLESTEDEAQHMKQLIDQMLFLAKSDTGENHLQVSEIDLSEIVEGSSLNFEPVAFEKNVRIETDIAPHVILEANQTQLTQLAHILIDNAVKYADENSAVQIILEKKNSIIVLTVNNHGNVISEEDIGHIFDRFYRTEKSRTTKGYGLGLSIAQNIVRNMNGKLTVQSNPTDGTTFTAIWKRKSGGLD